MREWQKWVVSAIVGNVVVAFVIGACVGIAFIPDWVFWPIFYLIILLGLVVVTSAVALITYTLMYGDKDDYVGR